jgi:hypothetical protein
MATVFKHAVNTEIGTTPVDVIQITPGVAATVIGLNLSNTTDFDVVSVDVQVIDSSSTISFYVRKMIIPPKATVKVVTQGEKLILPANTGLRIVSDLENSIDSTISFVEIS